MVSKASGGGVAGSSVKGEAGIVLGESGIRERETHKHATMSESVQEYFP